jgi:outer membrane murein-binding lipoprotein Lpp
VALLAAGCQQQPKARPLTGADVTKDVARFNKKIAGYAQDIEELRPTADKAKLGQLEGYVNDLRAKVKVMETQTPTDAVKTKGEILDVEKSFVKLRREIKKGKR